MPRIHSFWIWSRSQSFCSNTWRNTNWTSCRSKNRTTSCWSWNWRRNSISMRTQNHPRRGLRYFRKPNMWFHQLDVQESTSVSHSCSESEIISFDAGLRMDGLLAFDLWDVVVEVLCLANSTKTPTNPASGNRCETGTYSRNTAKSKRKGNSRCWSVVGCRLCSRKHTFLSRRISVSTFCCQRSSDQDDR